MYFGAILLEYVDVINIESEGINLVFCEEIFSSQVGYNPAMMLRCEALSQ